MSEIELDYERAARMVLCPMDGQPLKAYHWFVNAPSVFEHRDGTSHGDTMKDLLAAKLPPKEPVSVSWLPEWATEARREQ